MSFASGSVGINIPKMLALFKTGHEYMVEDIYVNTQVAKVSPIELLWDRYIYIYIYISKSEQGGICLFSHLLVIFFPFDNSVWFVKQLDMPKECILENIHAIVKDVASHKPAEFGK